MVDPVMVARARRSGVKIKKSGGVSASDLKKAIRYGISKINVDTDLRMIFTTAMREFYKKHPGDVNPRDALGYARDEMQKNIEKHMYIFGSVGKR